VSAKLFITPDEKEAVITKIRNINRFAELMEVEHSQVDPSRILGVKAFDLARVLQVEEDFLDTEGEHQHDDSVTSVGIEFDGQLDLALLNSWLSKMLRENGVDLFRSKGVLNIAGSDARYIFQGVHMLMGISSSEDGIGRGWKDGEKRTNRLVFIGRNLVREEIMANFKACLVKRPGSAQ
jgi:G3E family GTPase